MAKKSVTPRTKKPKSAPRKKSAARGNLEYERAMKKIVSASVRSLKRIEELKEEMNAHYELLEITIDELRDWDFRGDERLVLVDNFETKDTVYRTTSVRRFELKLVKK